MGPAAFSPGGGGGDYAVTEKTDYPFNGAVELSHVDKPVKFPLYVRIPGWAEGATVSVNGERPDKPVPGSFLKIDRTFASGDVVKLDFPMKVRIESPVENGVSLVRGPLVYSLKIKENRAAITNDVKASVDFPAWDITPASPWNYALALKTKTTVQVSVKPIKDFPWTEDGSPVTLTVPAQKVPAWVITPNGKNPPLPTLPLQLASKTEQVQLIPDGATQIRVTIFPSAYATAAPPSAPAPATAQ